MSVALVTIALLVALVCAPSVAAMTGMALAGGDGEPRTWYLGLLGALVTYGSLYNVLVTFTAYWGMEDWKWWAMWASPVAGLVGMLAYGDDSEDTKPTDWLVGVMLQLAIAVPPVLLLLSDRVTL